jgi:hypothetical protein
MANALARAKEQAAEALENASALEGAPPELPEADQDLLDYAHGASLELPGLIDYIRMNGALAGMVERQSRTIGADHVELARLRAEVKQLRAEITELRARQGAT